MTDLSEEEFKNISKMMEERQVKSDEIKRKQKEFEDQIRIREFPLDNINWHNKMEDVDFTVLNDFAGWEK